LNYQLAFFTLTAGPIQRYNDFAASWNKMDEQPREPREGVLLWTRLLLGLLKISILATWVHSIFVKASNVAEPHSLAHAVSCFYAYPAYLYFNFAGYTDVMIGIGGLLGFKLPENFNRPFLARNVLDFWDRWHISVTHWIRDYIFMTSYKSAATHFPRAARYWSYLLLFVALFLAGVWHGTTSGFVLFGALNGLGAAATRAYGDLLRARLGGPGLKAYLQNRTIRWIAVLATLHYVCFCMLFFALTPHEVQVLLTSAWHELVALPVTLGTSTWRALDAVPFVVAGLALVALWKAETIGAALARLAAGIIARPALHYSILCTLTAIVVFVLYVDWAFQQEPPPVLYMSF
jgi:D-alanyl-lipoteichoic acid acyltransferase DltB (MBOAT superfamily)